MPEWRLRIPRYSSCRCFHARAVIGPTLHGAREHQLLRAGMCKRENGLGNSVGVMTPGTPRIRKLRQPPRVTTARRSAAGLQGKRTFFLRHLVDDPTSRRLTPRHMPLVCDGPTVSTIAIAPFSPLPVGRSEGKATALYFFPKSHFSRKSGFSDPPSGALSSGMLQSFLTRTCECERECAAR